VLDTSTGMPAVGMAVRCERRDGDRWVEIGGGVTDADGRIGSVLDATPASEGVHRLVFDVAAWNARHRTKGFFPTVTVEFEITDAARRHHVPLLLSPFGYSTYRGS